MRERKPSSWIKGMRCKEIKPTTRCPSTATSIKSDLPLNFLALLRNVLAVVGYPSWPNKPETCTTSPGLIFRMTIEYPLFQSGSVFIVHEGSPSRTTFSPCFIFIHSPLENNPELKGKISYQIVRPDPLGEKEKAPPIGWRAEPGFSGAEERWNRVFLNGSRSLSIFWSSAPGPRSPPLDNKAHWPPASPTGPSGPRSGCRPRSSPHHGHRSSGRPW